MIPLLSSDLPNQRRVLRLLTNEKREIIQYSRDLFVNSSLADLFSFLRIPCSKIGSDDDLRERMIPSDLMSSESDLLAGRRASPSPLNILNKEN